MILYHSQNASPGEAVFFLESADGILDVAVSAYLENATSAGLHEMNSMPMRSKQ